MKTSNAELKEKVYAATYDKVYAVAKSGSNKDERKVRFYCNLNEFFEAMPEDIEI
jgi:polyribonucleotide nucleotidyltransferase